MGTANVAGSRAREPQEVKKRIGYLPESPPLYPEMEVIEISPFVGSSGIPSATSPAASTMSWPLRQSATFAPASSATLQGLRQRVAWPRPYPQPPGPDPR